MMQFEGPLVTTTKAPPVLQMLANDLRWRLVSILARSDYQVHELVHMVGEPANLVSYHLKQLKSGWLVTERRSSADRRDIYYSLDLERVHTLFTAAGEALHPSFSTAPMIEQRPFQWRTNPPVRVLFLCTHNSARSQMAEAILRNASGGQLEVFSAGIEPGMIRPEAVRVMADLGISMAGHTSKHLDQFRGEHFDYVITVCDRVREACPVFPDNPEHIHWSLQDPAAENDAAKREHAFTETARRLVTRSRFLVTRIEHEQARSA